jgi:hypothetical protein
VCSRARCDYAAAAAQQQQQQQQQQQHTLTATAKENTTQTHDVQVSVSSLSTVFGSTICLNSGVASAGAAAMMIGVYVFRCVYCFVSICRMEKEKKTNKLGKKRPKKNSLFKPTLSPLPLLLLLLHHLTYSGSPPVLAVLFLVVRVSALSLLRRRLSHHGTFQTNKHASKQTSKTNKQTATTTNTAQILFCCVVVVRLACVLC